MAFSVRKACDDDIPAILQMSREGWLRDYPGWAPSEYVEKAIETFANPKRIADNIRQSPYYNVLVADNGVVGVICAGLRKDGLWEIWWIHVLASHRGQGLGRQLVQHLSAQLPGGCAKLLVTTFQNYRPTLEFYKSLGFRNPVLTQAEYDGHLINDVTLELPLQDSQPK